MLQEWAIFRIQQEVGRAYFARFYPIRQIKYRLVARPAKKPQRNIVECLEPLASNLLNDGNGRVPRYILRERMDGTPGEPQRTDGYQRG
jgi:hypothetical protein